MLKKELSYLVSSRTSRSFSNGTLGDWATVPADLELKPGSKPFNSRYYPVPNNNKEIFRKELKRLI